MGLAPLRGRPWIIRGGEASSTPAVPAAACGSILRPRWVTRNFAWTSLRQPAPAQILLWLRHTRVSRSASGTDQRIAQPLHVVAASLRRRRLSGLRLPGIAGCWSRRSAARWAHLPVQLHDRSRRRRVRRAGGGSRRFSRQLSLRLLDPLPLERRMHLLSLREGKRCLSGHFQRLHDA